MSISDLANRVFSLTEQIDEESSQLDLYNALMDIADLVRPMARISSPIAPLNYLIDSSTSPSVIISIAVASKRLPQGQIFSGSIFFNSVHQDNLSSRLPADLAISTHSAFLLTCIAALKHSVSLRIKRVLILSKSRFLTNLLSNADYIDSIDISILAKKLKGIPATRTKMSRCTCR